jgi:hypothetical protein
LTIPAHQALRIGTLNSIAAEGCVSGCDHRDPVKLVESRLHRTDPQRVKASNDVE